MNIFKRLEISKFINGFGKARREYNKLNGYIERTIFMNKKFGKMGIEIEYAIMHDGEKAITTGWLYRAQNFFIGLVDWRAVV